uniref:Mitochondrial calcium uptake family member 3 n=1 Tax=Laticauda laticaudata TaxID=8630 RepID=A0A8C5WXF8_LATLA
MKNRPDHEDLELYATSRERRFLTFASLKFEGQLFMTPYDFIQSVSSDEPRQTKQWKMLSKQELNQILIETPPVWKGSSKLFRNLQERGIISYTEYLFLLCILTKPHAGFRIAFNMFDTDGNEMVDKKEFLVLQDIFRKKNEKKERKGDEEKRTIIFHNSLNDAFNDLFPRSYWDTLRRSTSQALFSDLAERADDFTSLHSDTTLLIHFFGKKGKAELNFEDFYRFMDNLQTEILEIEFLSYSNGMNTISEEDFAHILLRYTNVENTSSYLENVRCSIPEEQGITFDEFRSFFQFLNNLEDFAIAMQMYNFANRSVGQDEFKRAVYVATGLKLSPHLVNTVFKIFDVDKDDQLSYKEFIGIMKDRLHRGFRGYKNIQKYTTFKSCVKKELNSRQWYAFVYLCSWAVFLRLLTGRVHDSQLAFQLATLLIRASHFSIINLQSYYKLQIIVIVTAILLLSFCLPILVYVHYKKILPEPLIYQYKLAPLFSHIFKI